MQTRFEAILLQETRNLHRRMVRDVYRELESAMSELRCWHLPNNGGECIDADECQLGHSEFRKRQHDRSAYDASNSQGCCGPASAAMLLTQLASYTFDNFPA